MARKKKTEGTGEQLALIEVGPKNEPAIKRAARAYEKAHDAQLAAKQIADGKLGTLMKHIDEAGLQPLADGTIKFQIGKMVVKIGAPKRSCKVREKEAPEEPEAKEIEFDAEEEEGA